MNRYAYVLNNPLRYTDPTGRCAFGAPCPGWAENAIECAGNAFNCVRDPIAAFGSGSVDALAQLWAAEQAAARAAAAWTARAAAWTASSSAATAQAVWTSGPVEAGREYVADKSQDIGVTTMATLVDPLTFPQNMAALGISFMTVGDRRGSYNGLIAYQNAKGPVQWLTFDVLGNRAVTPGNITFARGEFHSRLYWHEYRHFQQSRSMGLFYLPVYLVVNAAVLGKENLHPMEIDANRYGRQHEETPLPWE